MKRPVKTYLCFQRFPKPDKILRLTFIFILNYLFIVSVLVALLTENF
jgi:hypothetical protein